MYIGNGIYFIVHTWLIFLAVMALIAILVVVVVVVVVVIVFHQYVTKNFNVYNTIQYH